MNLQRLAGKCWFRFSIGTLALASGLAGGAGPVVRNVVESGTVGLHAASEFRLADGDCKDCQTIPQALWYFRGDTILVPRGKPVDFTRKAGPQEDVRSWLAANPQGDPSARPPLLWIGSPEVIENVRINDDATRLLGEQGTQIPFAITPKIDSNLSYFDASSIRHFANRPLRIRGRMAEDKFIARTIWPEDYALNAGNLRYLPLQKGETVEGLVRGDDKKANQPLAARVLWQRDKASLNIANKPVLAFMLNGAQGDDDEAHGGHFAVATGRFGDRGEWGDWAVNNFYNLGSVSEKGIIASTLPMDAYMGDLNSGQSWYRPSYMLVAVHKHDRVPSLYQQAIGRVYNHFYRHDFNYRHTTANCAGISVDTLRTLGWNIPREGGDGRLKATVALPFMAIKDFSLASGKSAFDYLVTERTNLYPFVAFNNIGEDLLRRAAAEKTAASELERMLGEDVEALIYVRIPQFPSSRAFGQAPVASLDEYMQRVPEDRSQWKIVPVGPRNFPDSLMDGDHAGDPVPPSEFALWSYVVILGVAFLLVMRRRRAGRQSV